MSVIPTEYKENIMNTFLGVTEEAKVAAVNALLNLVQDDDAFYHMTAKNELKTRLKIIQFVAPMAHAVNGEHGLYLAEEYAQEQFARRKEEGEAYANR
tara:strand:- start:1028 stop:1321 length:294 start_codon:yes stop_codon:yes gene_type:complete